MVIAQNSQETASDLMAKRGKGKPFPRGKSGNPGGRPKDDCSPTSHLKQWATPENLKKMVDAVGTAAISGNMKAVDLIFDRLDGLLQPILQGPSIDLEAVAMAMKAKREQLRPGSTGGGTGSDS